MSLLTKNICDSVVLWYEGMRKPYLQGLRHKECLLKMSMCDLMPCLQSSRFSSQLGRYAVVPLCALHWQFHQASYDHSTQSLHKGPLLRQHRLMYFHDGAHTPPSFHNNPTKEEWQNSTWFKGASEALKQKIWPLLQGQGGSNVTFCKWPWVLQVASAAPRGTLPLIPARCFHKTMPHQLCNS